RVELLHRRHKLGRLTPEMLDNDLQKITRRSDDLIDLLNLLLDFSRIESGRLQINASQADLVELTRTVAESVQLTTERHQLAIDAPEEVGGLWDAPRLRQVLQNLLTNAVKYSPNGGYIEVRLQADDHHATVCVRDGGLGLAPNELTNVFERFYR